MLVVAGQIATDLIGKDVGVLHEVRDQLSTVAPITKWQAEVREAGEVPRAVHQAFLELRTGRPRPVVIEVPPDVLAQESDVELLEPGVFPPSSGDPAALEEAANALAGAARPVIWAGGGVITSGASAALCELAELLQAPVITTGEAKGAISEAHYLSLGVARGLTDPLRELFRTSDLVLAVGTRFATALADPGQQVVQIDIDPEEIGRNHERTLGVVADARMAIGAALRSAEAERPSATVPTRGDRGGSAPSATTPRAWWSPRPPSFVRFAPPYRKTACW